MSEDWWWWWRAGGREEGWDAKCIDGRRPGGGGGAGWDARRSLGWVGEIQGLDGGEEVGWAARGVGQNVRGS